jgi:hypothetical protein
MGTTFSASLVINSNRLPMLPAQGRQKASQAVRRAAFATQRGAAPFTPVRTGALKANFIMDFFNAGLSAEVKWAMFYAIFQNEGTRRGISAKQFAQKGAAYAWPQFLADMNGIYGSGV